MRAASHCPSLAVAEFQLIEREWRGRTSGSRVGVSREGPVRHSNCLGDAPAQYRDPWAAPDFWVDYWEWDYKGHYTLGAGVSGEAFLPPGHFIVGADIDFGMWWFIPMEVSVGTTYGAGVGVAYLPYALGGGPHLSYSDAASTEYLAGWSTVAGASTFVIGGQYVKGYASREDALNDLAQQNCFRERPLYTGGSVGAFGTGAVIVGGSKDVTYSTRSRLVMPWHPGAQWWSLW